jgi:hypothetical protein
MENKQVIAILKNHQEIFKQFNVTRLALFGSTSRNEAREDSDIDFLVTFAKIPTSKDYFGLQFYLEDLLGKPVDLITEKALRPELRPYIEKELINVTA